MTRQTSLPAEPAEEFALRVAALPAATRKREALLAKVRKLEADRAAKQQEISGRRMEKWAAVGTSILSNIRLFTGKKRTVSGVGSVLSKDRMENAAEAKIRAIDAQIQGLQADIEASSAIDIARFEERTLKPTKTDVTLIRYEVVWVY